MRHQALTMGLSMNEHGLYKMEGKKKGEKVDHVFHSEKDIFDYLHMEFKRPEERIDGRAVVIQSVSSKKPALIIEEDDVEEEPKKEEPKKEEFIFIPKKKETKLKENNLKNNKTKQKLIIESDSDSNSDTENEIILANPVILKTVSDFRKNGLPVLDKLNENELSSLLREAKKTYYNENPFLTDNEFDIIKEYIENKYPTNKEVIEIGSSVERNKVELPYFMGSMDKIKPDTSALKSWLEKYKGPYVISCKLDGVSGLFTTEGPIPKLYTRGDGKIGQDISHLIPYLRLPKTKDIVIRGEFIIRKEVFDKKYKTKFANPRNMVAGIINNKKINENIKDLHFVSYELMKPILKPSEQMKFLGTLDVETVKYKIEKEISNDSLSTTLIGWRESYEFEIDGIIITNDKIYDRQIGNPEHSFAFKMVLSDQIAEAKVVDVIWTPSKDGYLKPRVQIEPIHLSGVKIEYATGFNGEFIYENKIGVGAIIEIIRSGDVIPHIRKVVEPAVEAKMPSVPYKWNETHVDVILENKESDETVREKNITGFFRGIGVEGLSSGNVSRLVDSGFDSISKIINMTIDDFLTVDGFKQKMASKLYNGIREKLESSSLITIMAASNIFGRGFSEIKLELIMKSYPDVLTSNESSSISSKISKVAAIKGMALKTAESFVEKIPKFIQFMEEIGLSKKLSQKIHIKQFDETNPLFGKTIILTGFRDNDLQNELKDIGVKIGASVSKSTFIVIVKDLDEATTKVDEAKKLGIPIMTVEQFREKYL